MTLQNIRATYPCPFFGVSVGMSSKALPFRDVVFLLLFSFLFFSIFVAVKLFILGLTAFEGIRNAAPCVLFAFKH